MIIATKDLSWSTHVTISLQRLYQLKLSSREILNLVQPAQIKLKCYNTMIAKTYFRICQSCLARRDIEKLN